MNRFVSQQKIMNAAYMYNRYPTDERLRVLLSDIEEFYLPPPENICSWCGRTDSENEDDGYGPCTDITVTIAEGEEGSAKELRWACNDHLIEIPAALIELGFASHRHGGINFLEDSRCPGWNRMADCPTPEEEEL